MKIFIYTVLRCQHKVNRKSFVRNIKKMTNAKKASVTYRKQGAIIYIVPLSKPFTA